MEETRHLTRLSANSVIGYLSIVLLLTKALSLKVTLGTSSIIIDGMSLTNCKVALNIDTLERSVKGMYDMSFVDWNSDALSGKSLEEYKDIR